MQPFHKDEMFAVLPHQDRALQADLEDALGDLLRLLGIERRASFHRHMLANVSRFIMAGNPVFACSLQLILQSPCCARAASGRAAAPPSSVMNSHLLIQSPRRRGRAASAAIDRPPRISP